jgi:peptidyl-dipeptidase A
MHSSYRSNALRAFALLLTMLLLSAAASAQSPAAEKKKAASVKPPTVDEARAFLDAAEKRLLDVAVKASRAGWVQENFITDDTEEMAAEAAKEADAAATELAVAATRFDHLKLPAEMRRKMDLLKLQTDVPAPRNPAEQDELAKINASLAGD